MIKPCLHPLVVTLCGSTRFKKEYQEWNRRLTLEGHVVLSVAWFAHADGPEPTVEQKELLDRIHLRKIDLSQAIFVFDVEGYIGQSTRREIDYAYGHGKLVRYLSEILEAEESGFAEAW